jgi:hypothetical protein
MRAFCFFQHRDFGPEERIYIEVQNHRAEKGVGQGADFWYPSMRRPAPPRSQRR